MLKNSHRDEVARTNEILVLNQTDVSSLFDNDSAFESQLTAFTAIGQGTVGGAGKVMLSHPGDNSVAFAYAARLSETFGTICKFGSLNPNNAERGLQTINATILALDAETGRLQAIMDGTAITTRRTAAATALAVTVLANPGAIRLAILGYGVQAREHIRMLQDRSSVTEVRVWGRSESKREAFVAQMAAETGLEIFPTKTAREAVRDADVIVLCTTANTPVLKSEWISKGATVISVGSISADRCEVGQDLIERVGRVIVDDARSAQTQAGPIIEALRSGLITDSDLVGLGEIVVHNAAGRRSPDEVIYYNTTGIGMQDAAAAALVIAKARAGNLGYTIRLEQDPSLMQPDDQLTVT